MENIKNLILDYGNVIFEIDFKKAQNAFAQLGIPNVDVFFAHTSHNNLFNDFETAAITPAAFRNGIREAAGNPRLTDGEIDAAWNSLLIGVPDKAVHEVLLKLRKRYRLFLLSNNNEIHYQWIMEYLQATYQLANYDDYFEKAYFSQQMQLRKPEVAIFQQVLTENHLDPAETLFIDDSPQHIAGAQRAGLHTLLMTAHPKDLEGFLEENGIL